MRHCARNPDRVGAGIMLNDLTSGMQVYIVTGYSDLRKGIDGLATIIQGQLNLDPFSKWQIGNAQNLRRINQRKGNPYRPDLIIGLTKIEQKLPVGTRENTVAIVNHKLGFVKRETKPKICVALIKEKQRNHTSTSLQNM